MEPDLCSAYILVLIRQVDEWKMPFNTTSGTYDYCVIPYGLSGAPLSVSVPYKNGELL